MDYPNSLGNILKNYLQAVSQKMAYLKDLGEKRKLAAQETTEEATDSAGS